MAPAIVKSRAFHWFGTLWGHGCATLLDIESKSEAIWGKLQLSKLISPRGVARCKF